MGPDGAHWRPLREMSSVIMKLLSVITERSRLEDVPEAWRKAPLPKRPWVLCTRSCTGSVVCPCTPRAVLAPLHPADLGKGAFLSI